MRPVRCSSSAIRLLLATAIWQFASPKSGCGSAIEQCERSESASPFRAGRPGRPSYSFWRGKKRYAVPALHEGVRRRGASPSGRASAVTGSPNPVRLAGWERDSYFVLSALSAADELHSVLRLPICRGLRVDVFFCSQSCSQGDSESRYERGSQTVAAARPARDLASLTADGGIHHADSLVNRAIEDLAMKSSRYSVCFTCLVVMLLAAVRSAAGDDTTLRWKFATGQKHIENHIEGPGSIRHGVSLQRER